MPPLVFERMQFLDRKKNPWFEHGEAEYFLAERDGEPVGRISAHLDRRWDEYQGGRDAMFGFFETAEDPEVVRALFDAATEWAAARGRERILGPMDFTTNDEIGILIEGFERRPMILEPWHPPYYQRLIEAEGFAKAMDVLMWELRMGELKEGEKFDPSIHEAAEKALRDEGIVIRNMRKREMAAEVRRFMDVYNEAWGDNWGFVPITDAEVEFQAQEPEAGARRGVDLHGRKGRRGGRGGADPAGHQPGDGEAEREAAALRLGQVPARQAQDRPGAGLRPRGQARLPPHRRRRRALPRAHRRWRRCRARSTGGEMGWILETNEPMNRAMEGMGGKIVKKYRLYERSLAGGDPTPR